MTNVTPFRQPNDDFRRYWDLGYTRLISVIPPTAPIWEHSSIYKAVGTPQDVRGKAPGWKRSDGLWCGFRDWQSRPTSEDDIASWARDGASLGVRTGAGLLCLDADTYELAFASLVKKKVEDKFGLLPARVGNDPKAAYVFRTSGDVRTESFSFGPVNADGKQPNKIEMLSEGAQFVAEGVHPKTRKPYFWPRPLPKFDDLPCFSPEQIAELMAELRSILPNVGASRSSSSPADRAGVDQTRLAAPLDLIRKAVRATPNTAAHFNGYEDYRDFGIALKASLQDEPDEAFHLWEEWCLNSEWADNALIEKHWNSFKPPFGIGADYVLHKAAVASGGVFNGSVEKWFEPVEEDGGLFPEEPAATHEALLRTFTAASLFGQPIPEQEWLVKDFIPAKNVTLLGGDGGTGKSLLSLQLADAVASGGTWLGMAAASGSVLFLSAEDEEAELHRRTSRIRPDLEALDRLVFAPLAGEDAVLMAPSGKDGLLRRTVVFDALERTLDRMGADVRLLVLDTLADLFGGDEIKKIQARQFVAELRGVALRRGLTVLLLYHPSQSGMTSGTGTSGNTAWNNSVRSRLYFTADPDDGDLRHLEVMKANRSAKGEKIDLRYVGGKFVREGTAQAPLSKDERETLADERFMLLLDQFEKENRNVSHLTAPNYAPKIFAAHPLSGGVKKEHFAKAMDRLFASGAVAVEEYGPASKRRARIVRAIIEASNGLDLFDGLDT